MKILLLTIALSLFSIHAIAQEEPVITEEEEKGGFKKDHLFTGGSIIASFSSEGMVLGASPVFGYSITRWLDAGMVFNFIYGSTRHVIYRDLGTGIDYISNDRLKQTVMGPGAFVRIYPVKFLFLHAQAERNFTTQRLTYEDGSPSEKFKHASNSLLLGLGYASGREGIGSPFYHVSIMFDVIKDKNSPYVEQVTSTEVRARPIFRAGFQIPLFQGRKMF